MAGSTTSMAAQLNTKGKDADKWLKNSLKMSLDQMRKAARTWTARS